MNQQVFSLFVSVYLLFFWNHKLAEKIVLEAATYCSFIFNVSVKITSAKAVRLPGSSLLIYSDQ